MDNKKLLRYYTDNAYFALENPNPRAVDYKATRWDTTDCTIRALALATGSTWLDAFDYLADHAREDYSNMEDGHGFRRWVVAGGATWTNCPALKGKKRMTAREFAKKHPTGRYIITLAKHETACVDGKIRDVWNCGDMCVVGYLDMSNFKY